MSTPYDFIAALGWMTLSASLLILAVLVIQRLFSRWLTPQWRYVLWLLVFVRLVLPVSPESGLSVFNLVKREQTVARGGNGINGGFIGMFPEAAITANPPASSAEVSSSRSSELSIHQVLILVWMLGVGLALFPLVRGAFAVRRMREESFVCSDPRALALLEECRKLCGGSRLLELRVSRGFASPALVGIRRPYILLPDALLKHWSEDDLRYIFLHELMHLRRRDTLAWCVAAVITALHWFNPLVWLAFARIKREQEIACDAGVLKLLGPAGKPVEYGQTLFRLTNQLAATRPVAGALGIVESKSQLRRRIEMINKHRRAYWYQPVLGVTVVSVLLVTTFTSAKESANLEQPSGSGALSTVAIVKDAVADQVPLGGTAFKLTVHESDGEIIYAYGEDGKSLKRIEAKNGANLEANGYVMRADKIQIMKADDDILAQYLERDFPQASQKKGAGPAVSPVDTATTGLSHIIAENANLSINTRNGFEVRGDKLYFDHSADEIAIKGNATVSMKDSTGKLTVTRGDTIRVNGVINSMPRLTIKGKSPNNSVPGSS